MDRHQELATLVWDAYKDAHGVRPRHLDFNSMTIVELESLLDTLVDTIEENEADRLVREENASHAFEMRIQNLMMSGAKDRAMALRWVHEAEGSDGDAEYLCFLVGLPYGYFE